MIDDNKVRDTIYVLDIVCQCMENTQNSWSFAKDSCGPFEDKWHWNNLHVNKFLYSLFIC